MPSFRGAMGVPSALHSSCTLRLPCAQVLNDTYSRELRHLMKQGDDCASDATFISIDRLGADVRARFGSDYSVERVSFDQVR